jgi:hypothetical protein
LRKFNQVQNLFVEFLVHQRSFHLEVEILPGNRELVLLPENEVLVFLSDAWQFLTSDGLGLVLFIFLRLGKHKLVLAETLDLEKAKLCNLVLVVGGRWLNRLRLDC